MAGNLMVSYLLLSGEERGSNLARSAHERKDLYAREATNTDTARPIAEASHGVIRFDKDS
jgi:hypothetical protein